MERIEVVGTRNVDFTDKQGRPVQGLSLYFLQYSDNVDGKMADKMFVGSGRLSTVGYLPKPGDVVDVHYDRFGKPVEFVPVGSAV